MSSPSVCPSVHPWAGHHGGCLDSHGRADTGQVPLAHSYQAWGGGLGGRRPTLGVHALKKVGLEKGD